MHISKKVLGGFAVIIGLTLVSVGVSRSFFRFNDQRIPERFSAVEPGVLYRSNEPDAQELANIEERYHIKTLVIARAEPSEEFPDEVNVARRLGLKVLTIPIRLWEPISDAQIKVFFDCVDDPSNRPILLHCSGGRHRTGFLCAVYHIERDGWTVSQAIERMLSYGFDETDQAALLNQLRAYQPGSWKRPASVQK